MNREKVESLLELHEGKRNRMYLDSKGIETIGIGHNLRDVPLSDAAVSQIFQDDLDDVIREAHNSFPWFVRLDEVRQAAICDMLFNMGLPTFKTFKRTIGYLENSQYVDAGQEILRGSNPDGKSRYYHDVGRRAERISMMLQTGLWPDEISHAG